MNEVLTDGDRILCGHGGNVTVVGTSKLSVLVGGAARKVLVKEDVDKKPIPNCPTPVTASGTKPCEAVESLTAGLATKLTLGGKAVVLATVKGTTKGNPPAVFGVTPIQKKLTAI